MVLPLLHLLVALILVANLSMLAASTISLCSVYHLTFSHPLLILLFLVCKSIRYSEYRSVLFSCVCVCVCVYIYIYIEREREREREKICIIVFEAQMIMEN